METNSTNALLFEIVHLLQTIVSNLGMAQLAERRKQSLEMYKAEFDRIHGANAEKVRQAHRMQFEARSTDSGEDEID